MMDDHGIVRRMYAIRLDGKWIKWNLERTAFVLVEKSRDASLYKTSEAAMVDRPIDRRTRSVKTGLVLISLDH